MWTNQPMNQPTDTMTNQMSHNGNLRGLASVVEGPARPTHLDTSGSPMSNPEYSRTSQMSQVLESIRSRDIKIAVICDERSKNYEQEKTRVTSLATELNRVLCGSKVLVYEYTISQSKFAWLSYLRDRSITHYIFVGLPQMQSYSSEKSPESDFFNPKSPRILQCVVVRNEDWSLEPPIMARRTVYTPSHYLEKFLQLEGCDKDVTGMTLSHFSRKLIVLLSGW